MCHNVLIGATFQRLLSQSCAVACWVSVWRGHYVLYNTCPGEQAVNQISLQTARRRQCFCWIYTGWGWLLNLWIRQLDTIYLNFNNAINLWVKASYFVVYLQCKLSNRQENNPPFCYLLVPHGMSSSLSRNCRRMFIKSLCMYNMILLIFPAAQMQKIMPK